MYDYADDDKMVDIYIENMLMYPTPSYYQAKENKD